MKRTIAILALLAVLMSGCGQIDEPMSSAKNDDDMQSAAKIEVYTDVSSEKDTTAETMSAEEQITTENNSTTMNATESSSKKITTTEENAEPPTSAPETDTPDIPQKTTVQKTTEKITTSENEIITTTNVETEPNDITAEKPTQEYYDWVSDIFNKLNSLSYKPDVCDGIPEKSFVAEDGTLFQVNFTERWVWRNWNEEAYLTDELYSALYGSEPICLQQYSLNYTHLCIKDKNLIYVSDPLVGNTSYDYSKIRQRYIDMGQQCVYIEQLTPEQNAAFRAILG